MRLADTDILIDVQRGYAPAVAWFTTLPDLPAVPGLVVMELIQDASNKQQIQAVQKIIAPLRIIWPTEADCQHALKDYTQYHLSHGLGLLDALIGACAVGLGATLCTFNVKHYQVISGLVTEQPYAKTP